MEPNTTTNKSQWLLKVNVASVLADAFTSSRRALILLCTGLGAIVNNPQQR